MGTPPVRDRITGVLSIMTHFRQKTGTKSATHLLKHPFPDIGAFIEVVQALRLKNPLGCTSYYARRRNFQPVIPVRERYTAKFVYLDADGKQVGTGSEVYDSAGGYETGVASMISNLANIASHRGKIVHRKDADLFSVTLKCHDADGELYFISLARDRITVSSYTDNSIRKKVEEWTDSVPALS
jgi:hypothetical protein